MQNYRFKTESGICVFSFHADPESMDELHTAYPLYFSCFLRFAFAMNIVL